MTDHCRAQIDYPCPWVYKVIGRDRDVLGLVIAEVLTGLAHTVTPSRSSKGGAYHCLNVATTVASEAVRLDLYDRLRRHPAVVMIL